MGAGFKLQFIGGNLPSVLIELPVLQAFHLEGGLGEKPVLKGEADQMESVLFALRGLAHQGGVTQALVGKRGGQQGLRIEGFAVNGHAVHKVWRIQNIWTRITESGDFQTIVLIGRGILRRRILEARDRRNQHRSGNKREESGAPGDSLPVNGEIDKEYNQAEQSHGGRDDELISLQMEEAHTYGKQVGHADRGHEYGRNQGHQISQALAFLEQEDGQGPEGEAGK